MFNEDHLFFFQGRKFIFIINLIRNRIQQHLRPQMAFQRRLMNLTFLVSYFPIS
jgi:hypothetical protein